MSCNKITLNKIETMSKYKCNSCHGAGYIGQGREVGESYPCGCANGYGYSCDDCDKDITEDTVIEVDGDDEHYCGECRPACIQCDDQGVEELNGMCEPCYEEHTGGDAQ